MNHILKVLLLTFFSVLCSVSVAQVSNDFIEVDSWSSVPEQNYVTNGSITISGERLQTSSIWINGVARVNQGDGDWSIVFNNLDDGLYEYRVVAHDAFSSRQSSATAFTIFSHL